MNSIRDRKLLPELFGVVVLVAILHYVALNFSLYWLIEWFDIPMHFLGGFVISIGASFLFFTSGYIGFTKKIQDPSTIVLIVLLSVLVVGLAWEVWELFYGLTDLKNGLADTLFDIVMDVIGGITAFYYAKGKINE